MAASVPHAARPAWARPPAPCASSLMPPPADAPPTVDSPRHDAAHGGGVAGRRLERALLQQPARRPPRRPRSPGSGAPARGAGAGGRAKTPTHGPLRSLRRRLATVGTSGSAARRRGPSRPVAAASALRLSMTMALGEHHAQAARHQVGWPAACGCRNVQHPDPAACRTTRRTGAPGCPRPGCHKSGRPVVPLQRRPGRPACGTERPAAPARSIGCRPPAPPAPGPVAARKASCGRRPRRSPANWFPPAAYGRRPSPRHLVGPDGRPHPDVLHPAGWPIAALAPSAPRGRRCRRSPRRHVTMIGMAAPKAWSPPTGAAASMEAPRAQQRASVKCRKALSWARLQWGKTELPPRGRPAR